MIKKFLIFFVFVLSFISISPSTISEINSTNKSNYIMQKSLRNNEDSTKDKLNESLITKTSKSHSINGNYVANPFQDYDLFNFTIEDTGGTHTDGMGKKTYSNYVSVKIDFKYNKNFWGQCIINDKARVIKSIASSIPGVFLDLDHDFDLGTNLGYGVLLISRENSDGTRHFNMPVFLNRQNSTGTLNITKDGNYHFSIYLCTHVNGAYCYSFFDYEVPVRSYVYLKTKNLGYDFDVKDNGIYYDDFYLETLDRKDIIVKVNGVEVPNNSVFTSDGTYIFEVYGYGFLAEKFKFVLAKDPKNELIVNFSNIRKQTNDYTYEAENHFMVSWFNAYPGLKVTYQLDGSDEIVNVNKNDTFNKPGVYLFKFESKSFNEYYNIILMENGAPAHNHDILGAKRFNNFQSKWYEVYDDSVNDYYCFSVLDYNEAYNAALSLENDKVVKSVNKYIYDDNTYFSTLELTKAININARNNIKIVYYDYEKATEEKLFSPACFEDIIYLNKDFMFASVHPSESNKVTLTNLKTNVVTNVPFFTEIESLNLPSGKYMVEESDVYNNKTNYEVVIDNTIPELTIETDSNVSLKPENNGSYNVNYFRISELFDEFDRYAIVSVNDDYYLSNEVNDAIYSEPGEYKVRAYDRNGNKFSCTLTIGNNKLYQINDSENEITLSLADRTRVDKVYLNNKEIEIDSLSFNKVDQNETYVIYLSNDDGSKDIVKIQFKKKLKYDEDIGDLEDKLDLSSKVTNKDDVLKFTMMIAIPIIIVLLLIYGLTNLIIHHYKKKGGKNNEKENKN